MYYDLAATELTAFAAVGSIGPKCLPFGTIRMCYSGNETLKRAKVNACGSLSLCAVSRKRPVSQLLYGSIVCEVMVTIASVSSDIGRDNNLRRCVNI